MRSDRSLVAFVGFACFAAVSAATAPALAQNCMQFSSRSYAVGDSPSSVAIGDLNGDAIPDLAVANTESQYVSVLLGSEGGGFRKAKNFQVHGRPQRIAIADLDGDARPDLAVSVGKSQELALLYGDGLGGFAESSALWMNTVPLWLVVQDLNGDAKPDIVVAKAEWVTVRISKGGGVFKPPVAVVLTSGLTAIAVGDLNGDTIPDLALARDGDPWDSISACFGDGLGGFTGPVGITEAFNGESIGIGDVTGDAITDLVIGSKTAHPQLIPGVGDGAFANPKELVAPSFFGEIAVADFNADGRSDIVATSNLLVILASKPGSDDFSAPAHFLAGVSPSSIAIGDLDGDGNLDVVVANGPAGTITTLLGSGVGTFTKPSTAAVTSNPLSIVAEDFNGDSKVDLAIVNGGIQKVWVVLGNGSGTFQGAPSSFAAGGYPDSMGTADFNRDGKPDLAVVDRHSAHIRILTGDGNGGFEPQKGYVSVLQAYNLRIGDFNGDEFPDVAITTENYPNKGVAIHLGNDVGGLGPPAIFLTGSDPTSLSLGDLDGDGKLDFATTSKLDSTRVTVRYGDGLGGFGESTYVEVGAAASSVLIADLNGDAKMDLATTHLLEKEVSILWGKGNGKFSGQSNLAAGPGPTSLQSADVDSDGLTDLVVLHRDFFLMSVLRGKGAGEFGKAAHYVVGTFNWKSGRVAIADLNSDGMLDVALASPGEPYPILNGVTILLNQCANSFCSTTAQALWYGNGKPGPFGLPKATSSTPRLGVTATLTFAYPWTSNGMLLVGHQPGAVPFDGGTLLVEPIAFVPLTLQPGLGGKVTLTIPVPAAAVLCGANIYFQAMFVDLFTSSPYHTVQSEGLHWVIGS